MVAHWYGDTLEEFYDNVLKDYPEYSHLQGEDRLAASINLYVLKKTNNQLLNRQI